MDREGRSQPGRGGTGTADPVDADPAYDDRVDVETLPLARLAQAPPGTNPVSAGRRPSQAGVAPTPVGSPTTPAGAPLTPAAAPSIPAYAPPAPAHAPPAPADAPPAPADAPPAPAGRRLASSHPAWQLGLFTCYLAAGIAVTWSRVTYLASALPSTRDAAVYVWGFWWFARQVTHLGDPWATTFLAAPVGTQLAYHTLMPLPGLLMTPVTLLFGPSASYNLLSIACPGLLCYAMYRAAWLWLPTGFGAIAALVASPQIIAMTWQTASGGAWTPPYVMFHDYSGSGAGLIQMFAPSPRLAAYGLSSLAALYYQGRAGWVVIGYGLIVSLAALVGLVTAWHRPGIRQLGLLWLGCSVLALGPVPWILNRSYHPMTVKWDGVRVSALMPFTWFVRLPGLANFREAARLTELGLVAAALLAGAAVNWLGAHARPVLVVLLALGVMEAGWSGNLTTRMWPIGVMPTALPTLDAPIAANHSHSIVVDVPFGIRGGLPVAGSPFPPESMVLATADGHPLTDGYASRIPSTTLAGIAKRPFYAALLRLQTGLRPNTRAQLSAARRSVR
jgi:hypothetical protein